MAETTTIEITKSRWKELNGRKEPGDSFDDVIARLLEGEEEQDDQSDDRSSDDAQEAIESIKREAREQL